MNHLPDHWQSAWIRGDGACCLSGNPLLKIFALSEKLPNPKILIYNYPNLNKISECFNHDDNGYNSIEFTSTEYLLTLGKEPNFLLTIWSWRNGEKLKSISTKIHDYQEQIIKISSNQPTKIAQLGKLSVYCEWSHDHDNSILAIVDNHGHVYITNKESCEIKRVIFSQRCTLCTNYEVPIICWYRGGIILKTTFCQIRYYQKNPINNYWQRKWCIKTNLKPSILTCHPTKKDRVYYYTHEGYLNQINIIENSTEQPVIHQKLYLGDNYKLVNFIYPWGYHLAVVDNLKLTIINAECGRESSSFDIDVDGKIIELLTHFDFPLIVVTTNIGEVALISILKPKEPCVIRKCLLQKNKLDVLKFSKCGRHLFIGEKSSAMIDVVLYEVNGKLKIVILLMALKRIQVGCFVLIYEVELNDGRVKVPKSMIKLPSAYQSIHYAPGDSLEIIATPYLSNKLHFLKVHDERVDLSRVVTTGHQVRGIKLSTNREVITTYGYDGLVIVFKIESSFEQVISLMTHHRKNLGIDMAICRTSGDLIVALGHDKSLVCMKFRKNIDNYKKIMLTTFELEENNYGNEKKYFYDYSIFKKNIIDMLSDDCLLFPPENQFSMTWIDWKKSQDLKQKSENFYQLKSALIDDLNKIKNKISNMLDENEISPDIEQLSISHFDLNFHYRQQKIHSSTEEREKILSQLKFLCNDYKRIEEWIKIKMWDPQEIKDQSIFEIYGDTEIKNYSTETEDPQEIETTRLIESFISSYEYKSQKNIPEIYLMLKKKYNKCFKKKPESLDDLPNDEDHLQDDENNIEEFYAASGTTTYRFIDSSCEFSQFEDYTFEERFQLNDQLMNDAKKLKNYFNKIFSDMVTSKQVEISKIQSYILKIRHIDSELQLMFNENVKEIPEEPAWTSREKPESVIQVNDDEVQAKIWISPSEQDILMKKHEEAEKLRLLLLADDFRERALMAMMDGVMEVRWEDIIKKDIPRPSCMINKIPEDYNLDDILSVKKYESSVEKLSAERDKYKKILYSDYLKTMELIKRDSEKFNNHLKNFFIMKMKLESAIQQINLIRARGHLEVLYFLEAFRKKIDLNNKILIDEMNVKKIQDIDEIIKKKIPLLQNQRKEYLNKEKLLLKKFTAEFSTLGQKNFDVIKKEYNKRPKVSLKSSTVADILELGKCILMNTDDVILPEDCFGYLRTLEAFDIPPTDFPESIEIESWQQLCKLRRLKIDLEMKIKANISELNDIEKLMIDHCKKIEMCREESCRFDEEIKKINDECDEFETDCEIQLVLNMGQVEIPVEGYIDDASNAQLIIYNVIKKLNDNILSAGSKKIREISRTIKCHGGTIYKEWEHKYRRKKIDNYKDDLYEISNFFVTKNIYDYLKKQSSENVGIIDKTSRQFEHEIEAIRSNLNKSLRDWLLKVKNIEKKIDITNEKNRKMDEKIKKKNIARWILEFQRDILGEDEFKKHNETKLKMIMKKSKLLRWKLIT
ncbi:cilia- and flagella-associated protein 43-like [Aphidius gifuensis]|uniref:cilia- and flagella-associated protein 43-like n=1 Tax=Aphidius gifuensis TaxID=684658 RepID=UPI001CDCEA87|nr:cilia- and flagella-associated protein 43-like [Aphidius gifuensis]